MTQTLPTLDVRLARTDIDLRATQRLRYDVFVNELGASGPMVDHLSRLEVDAFDAVCDHLVLVDPAIDPDTLDHVVAAYRLLPGDRAARFGRFYCDAEYDLTRLREAGRRVLELGRSCVRPAYRGGAAMFLLWNALADYVLEQRIEIMFGVASFHGTDVQALQMPLSWLHHHHLAPEPLRVPALAEGRVAMDLVPRPALDRRAALAAMPSLIKAYLRLGGFVGEGAYVDRQFNTTDVMLLMDTAVMSEKHREFFTRRQEPRS